MSLRLQVLNRILRHIEKPRLARAADPAAQRKILETQAEHFFRTPDGVTFAPRLLEADGLRISAIEAQPDIAELRGTLLYLHGGAYVVGSAESHKRLAGQLAVDNGVMAVVPDYRLAPEHPFPAAHDDAVAAYRALVAAGTSRIVLAGDSAGGGLCFATLNTLLAAGDPLPVAVIAFSPWADLTLSSGSHTRNLDTDVLLPPERIPECRDYYLAGAEQGDPRASPIFGDFTDAPPALIQVSRSELLEDDGRRLARKLKEDSVAVTLQSWDDTPHVWQIFHGMLPEADAALDNARRFLQPLLRGEA